MVNWKSLIMLFILSFSSFTFISTLINDASGLTVFFSDDFDGQQVDSSKWVIVENTNMSGHPSYGGNLSVSDGSIALSSSGSTFPWVYTKNNPFPETSDFSVEFNLTFTCLGDWGCGIRIFDDSPTKDADKWTGSILIIQAGDEDTTKGKITVHLFGEEVHRIYVPGGFKPRADPHIFRLDYHQGNYTMYVDDIAVGSVKSDIRASAIGLGHPFCYYLPFSPQKVAEWGYWGWTSLEFDYIKVATDRTITSNSLFEDHFDGTTVDTTKWLVTENTNISGHPAWGGKVAVQDGQISFSSNGSTFPWVRTLNNPFPTTGDFTVEFDLTYTIIGDSGNGIRIFSNRLINNEYDWANNIFTLWAHDEGETTGVILIELFNQVVYKDYVAGFKPSSPPHQYKLEFANGNYTVHVDDKAVATNASQLRPTSIGLGHPPIPTLPYPPETTQTWAYWGWTSFEMDSIKVTMPTSETPNQSSPEPTTQPINVNTTFLVESNSTLSVVTFNAQNNKASFNVSGPSGTYGYIRCTIPKTMLPNASMLNVYLDNEAVEYSLTELSTESWLLYFTYSHSSHIVNIELQAQTQKQIPTEFTIYAIIFAAAILALLISGILVLSKRLNS